MAKKTRRTTPRRKKKTAAHGGLPDQDLIRLTMLQLAILASIQGGPKREQYGSRIIQDVTKELKLPELPLATVYTALRRLEQRGLLSSRWGAPGPDGGNRRRFYKARPEATKALRAATRMLGARASR